MSVVPGPMTADLAAALHDEPRADTDNLLAGLLHRSLLIAEGPIRPPGRSRFTQLTIVRAHGARKLDAAATERLADRRDAYVLDLVVGWRWIALAAADLSRARPVDAAILHSGQAGFRLLSQDPGGARPHLDALFAAVDGFTGDDLLLAGDEIGGLTITAIHAGDAKILGLLADRAQTVAERTGDPNSVLMARGSPHRPPARAARAPRRGHRHPLVGAAARQSLHRVDGRTRGPAAEAPAVATTRSRSATSPAPAPSTGGPR